MSCVGKINIKFSVDTEVEDTGFLLSWLTCSASSTLHPYSQAKTAVPTLTSANSVTSSQSCIHVSSCQPHLPGKRCANQKWKRLWWSLLLLQTSSFDKKQMPWDSRSQSWCHSLESEIRRALRTPIAKTWSLQFSLFWKEGYRNGSEFLLSRSLRVCFEIIHESTPQPCGFNIFSLLWTQ